MGRRPPTWRWAAGGRRGTCSWRWVATGTRSGTFPSRIGRSSGRSAPCTWAGGARRPGSSRRWGIPALAAIELEAAGAAAAARLEWERVLRDERLAGRPYETALAHFNLGEALLRIGDRAGGLRELGAAGQMLEVVADDFETGGETERAFDCYSVLLQLGKAMGSFETVAEGYLNMIRIIGDSDSTRTVQYYDDFVAHAVENKEMYAAAMAAREVAEYSLRLGLPWDRHYLERAAQLWVETARANQSANGPVDLSANAYQAAIDAATSLGDLALAGQIYAELAELPLTDVRRRRYRTLARRYEAEPNRRVPAPAFPAVLRRHRELHGYLARRSGRMGISMVSPSRCSPGWSPRSPIARSSRALGCVPS